MIPHSFPRISIMTQMLLLIIMALILTMLNLMYNLALLILMNLNLNMFMMFVKEKSTRKFLIFIKEMRTKETEFLFRYITKLSSHTRKVQKVCRDTIFVDTQYCYIWEKFHDLML